MGISLTSVLDGSRYLTPHPTRFKPKNDPVHIVQEAEWHWRPVWMGAANLAPARFRSPNRPDRSELLYRPTNGLSYSGWIYEYILVLIANLMHISFIL
jgi:hypothetical protein